MELRALLAPVYFLSVPNALSVENQDGEHRQCPADEVDAPLRHVASPPGSSLRLRCKARTLVQAQGPRRVSISQNTDGKFLLELDPPPISTLVLSGGGAKGLVYPGAIQALGKQGLAAIRSIHGASAGAISAALLASGLDADAFENMTDTLDMSQLLHGRLWPQDPTGKGFRSENTCELLAGLPGKLGLMGKLGANGVPLEQTLRHCVRRSVLQHLHQWLSGPGSGTAASPALGQIQRQLLAGAPVTFGMLARVSREIPEIKQLYCTAVRMDQERPQLMLLSAQTVPDMDIALAAHASGALPGVFSPVEAATGFDLKGGDPSRLADGGSLMNLPIPALIDPQFGVSPLPQTDMLVLEFQYDTVPQRSNWSLMLRDALSGCNNAAADGFIAAQLRRPDLAAQTVSMPLLDQQGVSVGLLDLDLSDERRDFVQNQAQLKVEKHLEQRAAQRMAMEFDTLDELLLALAPSELAIDFAPAQDMLRAHDAWTLKLDALLSAIDQQAGSLQLSDPALQRALHPLNQLASTTPGLTDYLARRLNHAEAHGFQRWLHVLSQQRQAPATALERAALAEYQRRADQGLLLEIEKNLIFRSQYKFRQKSANIELLQEVRTRLTQARSRGAMGAALQYLHDHYQSRWRLGEQRPLSSWTMQQALLWQQRLLSPPGADPGAEFSHL